MSAVAGRAPRASRLGDALAGQQRAFDLHPMDIARSAIAARLHRGAHRRRRRLHLRHAADLLRHAAGRSPPCRSASALRPASASLAWRWRRRRENAATARLRCRPTSPSRCARAPHSAAMPRRGANAADSGGQRIAAGEIVDAAIAFGLAEDRDDIVRRPATPSSISLARPKRRPDDASGRGRRCIPFSRSLDQVPPGPTAVWQPSLVRCPTTAVLPKKAADILLATAGA